MIAAAFCFEVFFPLFFVVVFMLLLAVSMTTAGKKFKGLKIVLLSVF